MINTYYTYTIDHFCDSLIDKNKQIIVSAYITMILLNVYNDFKKIVYT